MRILLADDHALFADALVSYIERAQPFAEVTAVHDLAQARAALSTADPAAFDLALIDWHMPGVEGPEVFRDLLHDFPTVKFVLISGVIAEDEAKSLMDLGLAGYFPKTLSGRVLVEGISKILDGETFVPLSPESDRLMPSAYPPDLFFRNKAKEQ